MRFVNTRCLIVGGTSGIGLAAAHRFAEEGARLVIAGLDAPDTGSTPPAVPTITCDVREPKQVAEMFQFVLRSLGGLDVLFHVAGGSGRRFGDGPLHECTDDGWS